MGDDRSVRRWAVRCLAMGVIDAVMSRDGLLRLGGGRLGAVANPIWFRLWWCLETRRGVEVAV